MNKQLKGKLNLLSDKEKQRLIKLAIEDKVSYKDITKEFCFSANEIEKIMRKELTENRYKRWRIRQLNRSTLKGRPRD